MTTNRLGTVNNLEVGGTYDILLIKSSGSFPEGKISFGFYDVPMKITGLQKVVQTFIKTLLTAKGSDPFYPNKGSEFSNLTINANILTNDSIFMSELKSSIREATEQVKSMLNVNTVDSSSCLASVEILSLDKIEEGIVLYLQISTLSGDFAAVAMPFPEFGLES